MSNDWKTYIERTSNSRPKPLTEEAVSYVTTGIRALDLGAGALNDTRFLIEKGFMVTALDIEPFMSEVAKSLPADKVTAIIKPFSEYEFPAESFDLVSAQFSLPFQSREQFETLFPRIVGALVPGGILSFNLFGIKDDWNTPQTTDRFFVEKKDVDGFLTGLDVIKNDERDYDGRTAAGTTKHWHVFEVIARK